MFLLFKFLLYLFIIPMSKNIGESDLFIIKQQRVQ